MCAIKEIANKPEKNVYFEALDGILTRDLHPASVMLWPTELPRPHMLGGVNCESKYSLKYTTFKYSSLPALNVAAFGANNFLGSDVVCNCE